MRFDIINDEQLIEGIIATILFPLFIVFFRKLDTHLLMINSMFAWFFTWVARKFSVNVYKSFKSKYGWKNNTYTISI